MSTACKFCGLVGDHLSNCPLWPPALRAERERLGITQEATRAILWGMPHRTFQDIESGRRQPPEWVMLAILEKLSKRKSLAGQERNATPRSGAQNLTIQLRAIARAALKGAA